MFLLYSTNSFIESRCILRPFLDPITLDVNFNAVVLLKKHNKVMTVKIILVK